MTGTTYPKSKTVYLSPPTAGFDDGVFVLEARLADRSTWILSACCTSVRSPLSKAFLWSFPKFKGLLCARAIPCPVKKVTLKIYLAGALARLS